jgi:hypothetical protein
MAPVLPLDKYKKLQDPSKAYQDLIQDFRKLDTNGDGTISPKDSKADVDQYDGDASGGVELYEYMTAINRQRAGAAALFSSATIDRFRQAYGVVETTNDSRLKNLVGIELSSTLLEQGLPRDQLEAFFLKAHEEILFEVDEFYQYLPQAVAALKKQTPTPSSEQILKGLSRIVDKTGDDSGKVLRELPFLLGVTDLDGILKVLDKIKAHSGGWGFSAIRDYSEAVQALQKNGFSAQKALSLSNDILAKAKTHVGGALALAAVSAQHADPKNPARFREAVLSLTRTAAADTAQLAKLGQIHDLNPTELTKRESLGAWIAAAIDKIPSGDAAEEARMFQRSAVLINHLHDQDQRDDLIRKTVAAKLEPLSLYRMISLAGSDRFLYTSTFRMLFDRIKAKPGMPFIPWALGEDPGHKYLTQFVLNLSGFNLLGSIFHQSPDVLSKKVMELLQVKGNDDLIRNVSLLQGVVGDVLKNPELKSHRAPMEKHLLGLYQGEKDSRRKTAIGFLLKLHQEFLKDPKAHEITEKLPPILSPKVPAKWLQDKTLRGKFYFYKDERYHFELIQKMYAEPKTGFGFSIVKGKEKDTVTMRKHVNGIALEVVVTQNNSDVGKRIQEPDYDIIAHRGHSPHLEETFSGDGDYRGREKLLYAGSCGSFRSISGLMEHYQGNYFIADKDVGRGRHSNLVLYYLMEGIASGKKDWNEVESYVQKKSGLRDIGLIFPNHPSLLLYDYLEAAKAP